MKPSVLDLANSRIKAGFRLLLVLLLVGCTDPGRRDVVGHYRRSTSELLEKIEIKDDGTFSQTVEIKGGKIWNLTNTWTLSGSGVMFNQFYNTYDTERGRPVIPPSMGAFWIGGWKGGLLVFDDAGSYIFEKSRP